MEESFWGLIVNSGRRYEQVVEESFHVSKACLDPSGAGPKGHTTLFIDQGGEEFILTVLGANNLTDSLDLNFAAGNKICFRSVGPGTIHLTGYIMDDDEVMMGGEEEESESEEEDMPQLVEAGNKRKMTAMDKPGKKAKMENGKLTPLEKAMKSREEELKTAKNMQKKVAMEMEKITQQEDEDSDEDDSDYEDMDDEEDGEEEEDDDDEDDDDDDDEDEDDEDDDDDEEEEEDSDEEMEEVAKSPKKQEQKTPKKNEKSPKSNDKSPKSNEKTPKSNEKTPKKNEKTPSKEDKKTPKKSEQNGVDKKGDKTPSKAQQTPGKTPKTPKRMIKGGISVEDLVVGNGPEAKRNKFVGMYYEGRLASNKKVFDKKLGGEPFKFRLGAGEVIKGWDLGVEGMKVGGKRRLTIPAKMAYGSSGAPPSIPPNATLTFDVECKVVS